MFFPSTLKSKPAAILLGLLMLAVPSLSACSQSNSSAGSSASAEANSNAIEVGILLVVDDIATTRQRYDPLLKALSKEIGQPIVFVPLTPESQFNEVETGSVDFVLTSPLPTVQLRQRYSTEILATVSSPNIGEEFGGVIVVRPDSAIESVADLRDKSGACVNMTVAAGGCLFQMYHLQQEGVDPFLDVASIKEIPSQGAIVQSVVNGEVDFGFVRTGQIEKMVDQGLLSADAVKILAPAQGDYPFPHTTRLYPNWAFSATQEASADVVNKMQQALLNLPAGDEALATAKVEQFVPAADYGKINELIDTFGL